MPDPASNRRLIERFWEDLYRRDFEKVGAYFTGDGEYTDVPTPDDDVARGPREIAARLRLGLEPLQAIIHHPGPMAERRDRDDPLRLRARDPRRQDRPLVGLPRSRPAARRRSAVVARAHLQG